MKNHNVFINDSAREFRANEMFFSTTDLAGRITAGNEVFTRITGCPAEALIGSAHNIIRHPHMPRAAFRLVWDFLKNARRTAAVVKNRAHDGAYYWVVALFAPLPHGHLSIRFKPTGPLLKIVSDVNATMLAEEERLLATGASPDTAMDASSAILMDAVRSLGFSDYNAFTRALLCDELKSRDAVLASTGARIVQPLPSTSPETEPSIGQLSSQLKSLYRHSEKAYDQLSSLFVRLDEFAAVQKSLEEKAAFVSNLTRELRVSAMNASLASTRTGSTGATLDIVSRHMARSAGEVGAAVTTLTSGIHFVSEDLRSVVFNLAAARLQIEMFLTFIWELMGPGPTSSESTTTHHSIRALQTAFQHSLGRTTQSLSSLETSAHRLHPTALLLSRLMVGLQVAQLSGVTETARITDRDDFHGVFQRIRELIHDTHRHLAELDTTLDHLDKLAAETPETARALTAQAIAMESEATFLKQIPAAV